MTQKVINNGSIDNDQTAESIRSAFTKTNGNFTELYGNAGGPALLIANNLSDVANAATSRTNLSAAKSGANSDITALSALSTAIPIAGGGTNATTASGTSLDNITGFSSTGFLKRTGAGTYSFIADPIPVANGGTNAASASGTALDNISGVSSPGLLKRTGAGTYSFIADPLPLANGGTGAASLVAANIAALNAANTFTCDVQNDRSVSHFQNYWLVKS